MIMLKKLKVACLMIAVCILSFSGNLYAGQSTQAASVSQQSEKVTGVVEDALGPVIGASVVIK